jgi:LysM repeat protein
MSLADLRKELEKQLKSSNKDNYALKNQLALLQYMEDKYNEMSADYQKSVKRTTQIRVQKGDNIRKISDLYGVPIENIRAYNELSFRDTLVPGKILHLLPTLNFRSSPDLPLVATEWHNLEEDDWKNETFPVEEAQMLLQWELRTDATLEKKDIQIFANEQLIAAVKGSEELTLTDTKSESIYGKNTYIYSATIDFSKKQNQLQNVNLAVSKNGKQLKSNVLRFYFAGTK